MSGLPLRVLRGQAGRLFQLPFLPLQRINNSLVNFIQIRPVRTGIAVAALKDGVSGAGLLEQNALLGLKQGPRRVRRQPAAIDAGFEQVQTCEQAHQLGLGQQRVGCDGVFGALAARRQQQQEQRQQPAPRAGQALNEGLNTRMQGGQK